MRDQGTFFDLKKLFYKGLSSFCLCFVTRKKNKTGTLGNHGFALPAIPVVVLCGVAIVGLTFAFANVVKKNIGMRKKHWDAFVASESARSGILLMEAALERRLWEMPPDDNCKHAVLARVAMNFSTGQALSLTAELSSDGTSIHFQSSGSYRGTEVVLEKYATLMDISDFLVFSKTKGKTWFNSTNGGTNKGQPFAVVAGDRSMYFEGPVILKGYSSLRKNAKAWDQPEPYIPLKEITHVIQAKRMYFLGGIRYRQFTYSAPPLNNSNSQELRDMLDPYATADKFWQNRSISYFTENQSTARQLLDFIKKDHAGEPTGMSNGFKEQVDKHIYPMALFGGSLTPPLYAMTGSDDGDFFHGPDRWTPLGYLYGPSFGITVDFTCYTDHPSSPNRKECSNSNDFPIGYQNWVEDADLSGFMIGSDGGTLDFPSLGWDNFDVLEQEAAKCGHIVDPDDATTYDSAEEDCDPSDRKLLAKYANSGGADTPCRTVYTLDFGTLNERFKNFNDGEMYQEETSKSKYLRRVIYVKGNRSDQGRVAIRIKQTQKTGLWTGLDEDVRKRLPIWLVSEDQIVMEPFQTDLTSPLDDLKKGVTPYKRKAYFNQDGTEPPPVPGDETRPLSLVFITPEQVVLNSPLRKRFTSAEIKSAFPVRDNKIEPVRSIFTDFVHEEEDGFKYGYRTVKIRNIALITPSFSGSGDTDLGFFPRGLWARSGGGSQDTIHRACLFDKPGDASGRVARGEDASIIPSYVNDAAGWIPPITSKFYQDTDGDGTGDKVPIDHSPYVFQLQDANGTGRSAVKFEGLRVVVDFASGIPAGKVRDLSKKLHPRNQYLSGYENISKRWYVWKSPFYYKDTPEEGAPCVKNLRFRDTGFLSGVIPKTQINSGMGQMQFIQRNPSVEYSNIGTILNTNVPITPMGY